MPSFKCQYDACPSTSADNMLHRFPRDAQRCRQWIINCQRYDLMERDSYYLNNNCRLCSDHFEDSQFMNQDSRNRLIWNAIPTIFSLHNPLPRDVRLCCKRSFQGGKCNVTKRAKLDKRKYRESIPAPSLLIYADNLQVLLNGTNSKTLLHTLPDNLSIKCSSVSGGGYGVWCNVDLPKGVRFGPYENPTIHDEGKVYNSEYCQQMERKENLADFVDGSDQFCSNWLQYINFASSEEQQNLLALKCRQQTYYYTYKHIPANTELLVWFIDEYVRDIDSSGKVKKNALTDSRTIDHNKDIFKEQRIIGQMTLKQYLHIIELQKCITCGEKLHERNTLPYNQRFLSKEKQYMYFCDRCRKYFQRNDH